MSSKRNDVLGIQLISNIHCLCGDCIDILFGKQEKYEEFKYFIRFIIHYFGNV